LKPIKKSLSAKAKAAKAPRVASVAPKITAAKKPARSRPVSQGEVAGPDERRPQVKADEIYGDTKIPEHIRKH
jgi:hypothetical protein